jgi:hypothetical protein
MPKSEGRFAKRGFATFSNFSPCFGHFRPKIVYYFLAGKTLSHGHIEHVHVTTTTDNMTHE